MTPGHITQRGWWHPGQQDGCPKCETTPDEARQILAAYVAKHLPHCHVTGLMEDANSYMPALALNPGHTHWPLGPGPILLSKTTGRIRVAPSAKAGTIAARMRHV